MLNRINIILFLFLPVPTLQLRVRNTVSNYFKFSVYLQTRQCNAHTHIDAYNNNRRKYKTVCGRRMCCILKIIITIHLSSA